MRSLEETKFINAGEVQEAIEEREDFPEKYEKELLELYKIYNTFVKRKAYKLKKHEIQKETSGN